MSLHLSKENLKFLYFYAKDSSHNFLEEKELSQYKKKYTFKVERICSQELTIIKRRPSIRIRVIRLTGENVFQIFFATFSAEKKLNEPY